MNNRHKNYGLFRRIFKWKEIYYLIVEDSKSISNVEIESLNKEIESLNKEISRLEELKNNINQKNIELNEEKINLNSKISNLKLELENYKSNIGRLELKMSQLKDSNKELNSSNTEKDTSIGRLEQILEALQKNIMIEQETVKKDTNELLKIFKKTVVTAGKIAELRLKDLITKTSINQNDWIEDLIVDSNGRRLTVEFGLRAESNEDKWIPVDSKLVGAFGKKDENGEIIIDENYVKEVSKKVNEVKKYLNKKNTTQYGILVLQSDSIYNEIYENHTKVLISAINDNSIFIMSPSAFIQFSVAINKLTNTFEKAKRASEIFEQIKKVMDHVKKMTTAWDDAFKKLSAIDQTHIKNIKTSYEKTVEISSLAYSTNDEEIESKEIIDVE